MRESQKIVSPYVYLALSTCRDLLMGGEFSSVTEKRHYINKYLKSFVSLMTEARKVNAGSSVSPDVIAGCE